MRVAAAAFHLRTLHAKGVVGFINNAAFGNRLVKRRPATAAFKLGVGYKQRVATYGAIIRAFFFECFVLTAPRPLGTFLPRNLVHIFRQQLFPFVIAHVYSAGVGVGIMRVFIIGIHTRAFYG